MCCVVPHQIVAVHPTKKTDHKNRRKTIKWPKKFLNLEEIIIVLKKFENPQNANEMSFEGNIVVNQRLERKVEFSLDKSHRAVGGSFWAAPAFGLRVAEDEDGVKNMSFEISDV